MSNPMLRTKTLAVKLTPTMYEQFKKIAEDADFLTSTLAYAIIKKYLAKHAKSLKSQDELDFL